MFGFFFKLGVKHILNIEAFDHIMFITALTAVYSLREWEKVLILATAFTIGHSTTLALATLNIVYVPSALIEVLIAVTIFLTGLANLFKVKEDFDPRLHWIKYSIAMFFGLIHGLGFSNYLKYMLGMQNHIVVPLFAFNIGLETGQIVVISILLAFNWLFLNKLKIKQHDWNLVLSGAAMGMALLLIAERMPALINGA